MWCASRSQPISTLVWWGGWLFFLPAALLFQVFYLSFSVINKTNITALHICVAIINAAAIIMPAIHYWFFKPITLHQIICRLQNMNSLNMISYPAEIIIKYNSFTLNKCSKNCSATTLNNDYQPHNCYHICKYRDHQINHWATQLHWCSNASSFRLLKQSGC